jgi:hypothetical protein
LLSVMQTRDELYALLDLEGYESLDASIVRSVAPESGPTSAPRSQNH